MSRQQHTPATDRPEPLLTIEDAAEYLGLSTKTIRRRIAMREIPFVNLGPRVIRFRREDLEAYVESRIQRPQPLGEVA